jgi:dCMP deaminase
LDKTKTVDPSYNQPSYNIIPTIYAVTKWDLRFLGLARHIATWSRDPSTQVGAVIVGPDKKIISTGFNGFPQNMPDRKEDYENRDEKYSRVVHGEINALIFAGQSVKGCTLYPVPFMPCDRCFVIMAQAGITRIVAPKPTDDQLTRWGPAFEKVRKYAKECNVVLVEVSE